MGVRVRWEPTLPFRPISFNRTRCLSFFGLKISGLTGIVALIAYSVSKGRFRLFLREGLFLPAALDSAPRETTSSFSNSTPRTADCPLALRPVRSAGSLQLLNRALESLSSPLLRQRPPSWSPWFASRAGSYARGARRPPSVQVLPCPPPRALPLQTSGPRLFSEHLLAAIGFALLAHDLDAFHQLGRFPIGQGSSTQNGGVESSRRTIRRGALCRFPPSPDPSPCCRRETKLVASNRWPEGVVGAYCPARKTTSLPTV